MRSSAFLARVAMCVTAGSVVVGGFAGSASARPPQPADNIVCDLTTRLQFPLLCNAPLPEVPEVPGGLPAPTVPTLPPADLPLPTPSLPLPLPALPGLPDGSVDDDGAATDLLGEGGTVDELLGDEGVVDEFLNGTDGSGGVGDTDDLTTGGGVVVIGAVDDLLGEDGAVDELLGDDGIAGRTETDVVAEGGTVDDLLCTISQALQVDGSTCPEGAGSSGGGGGGGGGGSTGTTTPAAGGVRGGNGGAAGSGGSLPVTGAGGVAAMLGLGGALTALGVLARRSLRLRVS